MSDDYYKILGVGSSASAGAIKRAFYGIAKANHPDRAEAQGWSRAEQTLREQKLKKAAIAYAILTNPSHRAEYDAEQREATHSYYRRRRPAWNPQGEQTSGVPVREKWAGFNFEDLRTAQPPPSRRRKKPKQINTDYKSFREMAAESAERILCEMILDALD